MNELCILHVEDDAEYRTAVADLEARLKTELGVPKVRIVSSSNFDFVQDVVDGKYDLLILDIKNGTTSLEVPPELAVKYDLAGKVAHDQIQALRYIPAVFLTGQNHYAPTVREGFVEVVRKETGWIDNLVGALKRVVDTRIPALNRALMNRIHAVTKDFIGAFVDAHWAQLRSPDLPKDLLAKMLVRRLAASFEREAVAELAVALDPNVTPPAYDEGMADPTDHYIIPPVTKFLTAGLIVKDGADLLVLVTPTCDLIKRDGRAKCDEIYLVPAIPVEEIPPYRLWREALIQTQRDTSGANPATVKKLEKREKELRARLTEILENRGNSERYFYLPKLLDIIPHRLLDFQQIKSIPYTAVEALEPVACLASPFAEFLTARVGRYFGRIGIPVPRSDLYFADVEHEDAIGAAMAKI